MKHLLQHLGQRGAILVMSAFLLPLVVIMAGTAIDVSNAFYHKSSLQNATDAAAVAGGYEYIKSKKDEADTRDKVAEYMAKNENGEYTIDDITYTEDKKAGTTRITVKASKSVPTYFLGPILRYLGDNGANWNVPSKSTAEISWNEVEAPKIFDYAMIGGYEGKAQPGKMDDFWTSKKQNNQGVNAITVHTSPIHVHGKVHTNGPVWVDMTNVSNGTYYAYADEFTCNADKDADLWSDVHDNYDDHYIKRDGAYGLDKPEGIRPSHINDDKIAGQGGPNHDTNWRFYSRFAPKDQQDYTAKETNTGFVDITISNKKSNPLTDDLKETIEKYLKMSRKGDLQGLQDQHVYIDTDGDYDRKWKDSDTNYQLNPSHDLSIYPGITCGQFKITDSESWRVWDKVYQTIICDGDITGNIPAGVKHPDEAQHLMFISLHGDINLQNSSPFYGYLYAPQGTVLIDGAKPIYGSIVAKHIIITTGGQEITATHSNFGSGGKPKTTANPTVTLIND